jgi:hypothetical protein
MEILIWMLLILGLVGAVVPAIPGPILSSVGLILALVYNDIDGLLIYLLIACGFVIFCLDLILPSLITKKSGGSKRAATGALIGMLLSIFTGPGLILGAFIGAFIGEFSVTQNMSKSAHSSLHAVIGVFSGILVKAIFALFVLIAYVTLRFL